jgi:hypothetical protein
MDQPRRPKRAVTITAWLIVGAFGLGALIPFLLLLFG